MKLYSTPPSILTLGTWVQRTQAWPSANSARRLAFGKTESECAASLAAGGYNRESFSIESGSHP